MIRFRRAAWAVLSCAFLAAPLLRAEPLAVAPPLDEALPWADTPQGVKTTIPFLLNATAIVPAGSVVRSLYVRPTAGGDSDGPQIINNGTKDDAYSRQGSNAVANDGVAKKKMDDIELAVHAAHRTVWPNIPSFRAALVLLGSPDIRLVYQTPDGKDLSDEAFAPVQGMILAEKDGALVVTGVIAGGNAERVGIAAGDRIESLNGDVFGGSLAAFVKSYAHWADASTISKPKPYLFRVRHAGSDAAVDVSIRPPPALGGSLLDQ